MKQGTIKAEKPKAKPTLFLVNYKDKTTRKWGRHAYEAFSIESVVNSFELCFKNKAIFNIEEIH